MIDVEASPEDVVGDNSSSAPQFVEHLSDRSLTISAKLQGPQAGSETSEPVDRLGEDNTGENGDHPG